MEPIALYRLQTHSALFYCHDFLRDFGGRTRVRTWDPLIKSGQFGYFSTFHLVQRCFNLDCYQIVVDFIWLVMVHSVA
jgi:hypothetical protein